MLSLNYFNQIAFFSTRYLTLGLLKDRGAAQSEGVPLEEGAPQGRVLGSDPGNTQSMRAAGPWGNDLGQSPFVSEGPGQEPSPTCILPLGAVGVQLRRQKAEGLSPNLASGPHFTSTTLHLGPPHNSEVFTPGEGKTANVLKAPPLPGGPRQPPIIKHIHICVAPTSIHAKRNKRK